MFVLLPQPDKTSLVILVLSGGYCEILRGTDWIPLVSFIPREVRHEDVMVCVRLFHRNLSIERENQKYQIDFQCRVMDPKLCYNLKRFVC